MEKKLVFFDVVYSDGKLVNYEYHFDDRSLYRVRDSILLKMFPCTYKRAFDSVMAFSSVASQIVEHVVYFNKS